MKERCGTHISVKEKLGYMQWHNKSEEIHKKGIKQKQCPKCKLWFWPDEY